MRYIIYISLLLLIVSCKKQQEPEAYIDQPDFYLQGEINGESIRITAGDNGYYMNTNVDVDQDQIAQYSGTLKKANCTSDCGPTIDLKFREQEVGKSDGSFISVGKVDFKEQNAQKYYRVSFNAEESFTSRAVNVNYTWDFGDGTSSNEKNPIHDFVEGKLFYDVCLTVTTSKGVASSLCNKVYLNAGCETSFGLMRVGHEFELRASHNGGAPNLYHWEFENGISASTPKIDYNVLNSRPIEKVCLTITDENGCVSQRCKNIVIYEELAFTAANFNYTVNEVYPTHGLLQTGTAEFTYIDQYGEAYSTKHSTGISGMQVQVLEVENYSANESGQPVKRIHVVMNADMESASGKNLSIRNLEGYLGVAYLGK